MASSINEYGYTSFPCTFILETQQRAKVENVILESLVFARVNLNIHTVYIRRLLDTFFLKAIVVNRAGSKS